MWLWFFFSRNQHFLLASGKKHPIANNNFLWPELWVQLLNYSCKIGVPVTDTFVTIFNVILSKLHRNLWDWFWIQLPSWHLPKPQFYKAPTLRHLGSNMTAAAEHSGMAEREIAQVLLPAHPNLSLEASSKGNTCSCSVGAGCSSFLLIIFQKPSKLSNCLLIMTY